MDSLSPLPGDARRDAGTRLTRRGLLTLGATGLAALPLFGRPGTPGLPGGLLTRGDDDELLDVRDYGAKGDGVRDDTRAVQRLIDASAKSKRIGLLRRGTYRITSSLMVPSGAQLYLDERALLLKDWAAPVGLQDALLRNADLSRPANGVRISGPGTIGARDHAQTGVVIGLYGHDVVLRDFTIDTYSGGQAIMYAGHRGRISGLTITNSAEETGTGGIRVFGGEDFLGTDCHVESGDDCLQFAPIGNPEAEPALYNQSIARGKFVGCTGVSTVSRFMVAVLEFTGGGPGSTPMTASITDSSFERCVGAGSNRGIVVKNTHSEGSIERLSFTDCTVDMARAKDAGTQEIRIQSDATSTLDGGIRDVTFTRTNVVNPVNSTVRVGGPNVSGLTFAGCTFAAPSGQAPLMAVFDGTDKVTLRNCEFAGAPGKRQVVAGPVNAVTAFTVEDSRFTGIGNNLFGVDVKRADGVRVTGSSFAADRGAANARGVRVSPEATGVVVERNDFTGIQHTAPVVDLGLDTVIEANEGA
jgi:polygalacturonase